MCPRFQLLVFFPPWLLLALAFQLHELAVCFFVDYSLRSFLYDTVDFFLQF